MEYIIEGTPISFDKKSAVSEIGEFIIRKCQYLEIFLQIYKLAKKSSTRDEIIKSIIDESVNDSKIIDKQAGQRLEALIKKFYTEDDKKHGAIRGDLFEFLFYKIGPLTFPLKQKQNNFVVKKKCKVKNDCGQEVGGKNDFDLGFYQHNCTNISEFTCEFLECKADLNNFLFGKKPKPDNSDLNPDALKKLNYMLAVYRTLENGKHVVVGLATPYYANGNLQKIIESGYADIKVFGPAEIIKAYKEFKRCQ